MKALLPLVLLLLPACGDGEDAPARAPIGTPEELAARLSASAAELAARPEHGADEVTIQHLLIAVGEAAGAEPGATRSAAEAEALAAELFARTGAGEDFDLLVKNHTDDEYPGIHVLAAAPADGDTRIARAAIPVGLGDAAWRLEVGEVGVVRHDPGGASGSALGFHLVQRLK